MTAAGPAAAAAAYLQRLPAAARAAAPADTARTETLLAASVAVALLAAWAIARSGLLERMVERLKAAGRPRWMAEAACGGAAAGLVALALTPFALTPAGAPALLPALILSLRQDAVLSLMGAVAAPLLYGVMRLAPRLWAPLLGGLAATLVFAAAWLPFARASGPANLPPVPAGAARAGLLDLIAQTHLPASEIYLTPTLTLDADVTGLGAARVSVSRGLWEAASPEELRASIGHLIGHYVHHDQLWIAVLLAAVALGLFVAVRALHAPAARLLGAPDDIANPAGAPVLIAVAVLWISAGVIADHALIRWINVRADQYSLDHAREPDGLAVALLHEWRGEDPDPTPLQEALFYDHPSLRGRLLHAMSWKAAHPG
jgi:STE24 endopeptidase